MAEDVSLRRCDAMASCWAALRSAAGTLRVLNADRPVSMTEDEVRPTKFDHSTSCAIALDRCIPPEGVNQADCSSLCLRSHRG